MEIVRKALETSKDSSFRPALEPYPQRPEFGLGRAQKGQEWIGKTDIFVHALSSDLTLAWSDNLDSWQKLALDSCTLISRKFDLGNLYFQMVGKSNNHNS